MSRLFKRAVKLQIDDKIFEGLRIGFKIEKTLSPDPNKAEINVYNLAYESRAIVQRQDAHVTLQAGYVDNIAQIFDGDIRTASNVRDKVDWITKIHSGDGEKAYRTNRVVCSFSPGASVSDVVTTLAKATGLKPGNVSDRLAKGGFRGGLTQFKNGFAAEGLVSKELERVLRTLGLTYSIQDGALQILAPTEANGLPPIVLDSSSGLIGSPQLAETGRDRRTVLQAKTLLQPQLVPGCRVQMNSEFVKGIHRVTKVVHKGDTHDQDWYSELELEVMSSAA